LLDREAVVARRPDAIVHQATALADVSNVENSTAPSIRRTAPGNGCVDRGCTSGGVSRFAAQSYASARYARSRGYGDALGPAASVATGFGDEFRRDQESDREPNARTSQKKDEP
jgi:hypothetical protein